MKVYKRLARMIKARNSCLKTGNEEWFEKNSNVIDRIMDSSPSGSGFDSGTQLIDGKELSFKVSFHHMNDNGMYEGWTDHIIKVIPDLCFDFILKISGKNKNGIKEYITETFEQWLINEEGDE